MSARDCIIANEKNIIELMLEKDLTRICFKIFSHLDSDSFCNARLVCHGWKYFIDYQFNELPNGIKWRSDKLISNFLNEDFIPKEEEIYLKQVIHSAQTDGKNIFLSTFYTKPNFIVSKYEIHSMKLEFYPLVWSLKLEELKEPALLHLCSDKLYAYESCWLKVGSYIDAKIYVIDSALGCILHKINDFPSLGDRCSVKGLCVLDNKALALSTNTKLNIYNIEVMDKLQLIYETELDMVLRIQNDGEKLIYLKAYANSIIAGFVARNFNTGEKISEIHAEMLIHGFLNTPH